MNAKIVAALLLTLSLSLAGQAFLRKGVVQSLEQSGVGIDVLFRKHLPDLLISPMVIGGCVLSGLGAICWLYVLGHLELGRALPLLGGLAYGAMFIVGRFWLGERTNGLHFLGIVLLVGGMYLLAQKAG